MAGVKGRSVGARPGAGRPKAPPEPTPVDDARDFLTAVMRGEITPSTAQLDAAKTLLRAQATGVKAERQKKADAVAVGKFAAAEPPRLVVNNS